MCTVHKICNYFFSVKIFLKLSIIELFTHLKIILLPCILNIPLKKIKKKTNYFEWLRLVFVLLRMIDTYSSGFAKIFLAFRGWFRLPHQPHGAAEQRYPRLNLKPLGHWHAHAILPCVCVYIYIHISVLVFYFLNQIIMCCKGARTRVISPIKSLCLL